MAVNLRGRNFLKLLDYTPEEIRYLLDLSREFKRLKLTGTPHDRLRGKNIVLLFEKTSTRTRCAFEVAGFDLGLGVTYLDPKSSQMGKKESVADTARVLGRMYDGIEYRGYSQKLVEELAKYSGVPVWNGLTDQFHPTQMLADLLTVEEKFGRLKGINFTYMGDARNNMGNSLMVACAKMGLNFTACAPKELFPAQELIDTCRTIAADTGATIRLKDYGTVDIRVRAYKLARGKKVYGEWTSGRLKRSKVDKMIVKRLQKRMKTKDLFLKARSEGVKVHTGAGEQYGVIAKLSRADEVRATGSFKRDGSGTWWSQVVVSFDQNTTSKGWVSRKGTDAVWY